MTATFSWHQPICWRSFCHATFLYMYKFWNTQLGFLKRDIPYPKVLQTSSYDLIMKIEQIASLRKWHSSQTLISVQQLTVRNITNCTMVCNDAYRLWAGTLRFFTFQLGDQTLDDSDSRYCAVYYWISHYFCSKSTMQLGSPVFCLEIPMHHLHSWAQSI